WAAAGPAPSRSIPSSGPAASRIATADAAAARDAVEVKGCFGMMSLPGAAGVAPAPPKQPATLEKGSATAAEGLRRAPPRDIAGGIPAVGRSLRVELVCRGKPLVSGEAEGALLAAPLGLSFWGGVDASTGRVVDRHHPLHGQ